MDLSDLPPEEERGLLSMLGYWAERWDHGCAGRFGLDQSQYQAVLASWPNAAWEQEQAAALAIGGAMRESLYGCVARRREEILARAGLSYTQACAVLDDLTPRIEQALRAGGG